jgi:hypothetical protein
MGLSAFPNCDGLNLLDGADRSPVLQILSTYIKCTDMRKREALALAILKKHLPGAEIEAIEKEIVNAMIEFSDAETLPGSKRITHKRLIELGNSLKGIVQELEASLNVPEPNPRKKSSRKQEEVARILNLLDQK